MEFIGKNKFAIFSKTFYNDKDIVIVGIVDRILRL